MAKKLIPRLALLPWPSWVGLKEVFSYGVFSFLTNILGLIWGEADKIILGSFVSTSSVAYLAVPRQMSFRISLAVSNLGGGLFPKIAAMEDEKERRAVFLSSLWIFLSISVVLFVPLTILFPSFLRLWIDPDFSSNSAWVAQIIAASCIVRGAFIAYDALFKGIGKPQYLTLIFVATAATSLILNLLLIPRYGLNGAGYCYVLTTFWGFCAIVYAWRKVLSQTEWTPLLRNFLIPLIAGIISGGLSQIVLRDHAIHSWFQWILYACVISGLVVCLIVLLDFIMNGSTNIRWFWQRIHSMPAFDWIRGAR